MQRQIPPITESALVDELLAPHAAAIGDDLPGYRNHVLRVLSYAMHFLDQDATARPTVEAALAYHDIGLWTAGDLAYLEPSEALLRAEAGRLPAEVDLDVALAAVHWHHKVTPYRGANERIVEAIRRADWIDATQGRLRKGLTRAQVHAIEVAIPNEGFHDTLQRLAVDLGGSALVGNLRVVRRVFKW